MHTPKVLYANKDSNIEVLRGKVEGFGGVDFDFSLVLVSRTASDFQLVLRRVSHGVFAILHSKGSKM